jgi:predicted HTH transcriptional regulator
MKMMLQLKKTDIPLDAFEDIAAFGQGYKTAFTPEVPDPLQIAVTVCAFTNTRGGNLFIGIDTHGNPVGLSDLYTEFEKLEQAVSMVIPQPDLSVLKTLIREVDVLQVEVREGGNKPYFVRMGYHAQAYVRKGAENIRANRRMLKAIERADSSGTHPQGLSPEQKILMNLFQSEQRITLSQASELLEVSRRRARKALQALSLLGYVAPSTSEPGVYTRAE